ncbi:MAG: small ribosomal subunit Rsm22 family protein [Actinomycetota bacterium]|nr:small ribosomal subunit Rsm22 family protein [Actinomycetota bacterium]
MTVAIDLPEELQAAVETRLAAVDHGDVTRDVSALSDRYRAGTNRGRPLARTRGDVLAYAAYRMPATFAAISAALGAVRELRADWEPQTVLDVGSGLGAGLWAAAEVWPSLREATAVDAEREMIALGSELAAAAPSAAVRSSTWARADITASPLPVSTDLVLVSYVLGELDPSALDGVLEKAFAATEGTVVVVEPGTPRGYANVIEARKTLLALGGTTTAPCPHDAPCPMSGGDWCHFAARLPRSGMHRAAKGVTLGYEDEKFSYAAVSREPTDRVAARILRHPQVRGGHVYLELCTRDGLRTALVTKRDKESFRRARKARWGEAFDDGAGATADRESELQEGAPTADRE